MMIEKASPYFADTFLLRAATGQNTAAIAKLLGVKSAQLKKWEIGTESTPHEIINKLRNLQPEPRHKHNNRFKFIDLFAGIGGLRKAFENAGGECVFTSEWNKTAVETYIANYGVGHKVAGDITLVDAATIPDHDILVGGFPCQPFSLAGVSKKNSTGTPHGFEDKTQGTLFFDVARIIKAKRPKAFLLENVRNLAAHDKGRTFEVIKNVLQNDLGYTIAWKVMEGTPWVPQRRPRIAIVGFRDGFQFDFDTVNTRTNRQPVLGDILHSPGEASENDDRFATDGVVHEKYTLTDGLWSYLQAHAALHKEKGNGFGYGMHGPNDIARTLTARYYKDGAEILIHQEGKNPRRLTPRECARLMGFEYPGESEMIIPVSDTQAYKQFGNSVIIPMFTEIAKAMAPTVINQIAIEHENEKAA
jgi:DNA (cytosine-5)-methyltransferase 1